METYKMLGLSTAHVTDKTSHLMDHMGIENITIFDKPDSGWFVPVPKYMERVVDKCPADLLKCLDFARNGNFDWIMFDCDIEPIPDLAVYEW